VKKATARKPRKPRTPAAPKVRDLRALVAAGKVTAHAAALEAFGLRQGDVVASRVHVDRPAITLITAGGRKVTWPDDEGRVVLTDPEKDGRPRATEHQNVGLVRWKKRG
jgi:hypothetical protein